MKIRLLMLAIGTMMVAIGSAQFDRMLSTPGSKKITESAYWRISSEKDVLFKDGEFPATISILSWEVLWRPSDYQIVTDLGFMYGNLERKDLELATYVRFREQFPKSAEAYYPEAEFYFKSRIYKPVIKLLEPTLSMDPKPHANSYRLLAHAYDRLGLLKESLATWEIYLKLSPDDAAAKVNRDKVKAKLNDGGS
jgi:tetratricopeptide (TPR) repeat protein